MQRVMIIIASLVAAAAVAVVAAPPAQGVSQSQLENAGWICFKPVPTDNLHCVRPGGLERVVLTGEAETMSFLVFRATDGAFLGTELIVRADIFNGQRVRPTRRVGSTRTSCRCSAWTTTPATGTTARSDVRPSRVGGRGGGATLARPPAYLTVDEDIPPEVLTHRAPMIFSPRCVA